MRRVVCRTIGPVEQLEIEDVDPLVPQNGQVVVDVKAAGVNFVDALFVQGLYQIKPPTPFTPGSEVAGVVSALGDGVTGVAVGDRVVVQCGLGGYAEQITASPLQLIPMPTGLSFGQAATLVQSYATMLFALTRRCVVAPGETVLVLGAGGGIGLAAIDVAKALGLWPIAAASSTDKLDKALAAGAEAGIDTSTEDLKTRARELSAGGVDLVIDPVGGPLAESALRALRVGGRYVVVGFASGEIPRLPANQILLNNRTVVGIDWGAWTLQNPEAHHILLADLTTLVTEERLAPTNPTTYPLPEAPAALTALLSRKVTGKLALVP